MSGALRQFFEIYPDDHAATVPLGFCIDGFVYMAGLRAADMASALKLMQQCIERAGSSLDNIARAVAYVAKPEDRDPVYGPWDAMFPDAADRPAFKVLVSPLPPGIGVRVDAFAVLGARRKRIDIPGVPARDPTVTAGEWFFTSRVHGTHPGGAVSDSKDAEIAQAFANIAQLAELSGAKTSDIVQLTAFGKDQSYFGAARAAFDKAFPDAKSRPAFQTLVSPIPPRLNVMLEAVGKRGERVAFRELYLDPAKDPAPSGAQIGPIVIAPWLAGAGDTVAAVGEGIRKMDKLLAAAGLGQTDIARVAGFLTTALERPQMNIPWEKRFPDMDDRPPHKYVGAPLAAGEGAALQVLALPGGARRCLVIPGMQHGDPMSMGARTGNLITSSRIFGMKTRTKEMSKTIEECAATIFENAQTLLKQGGADWSKLTQATAFIGNADFAAPVQAMWRKHLGDKPSARLNIIETDLGGGGGVPRLEILALL